MALRRSARGQYVLVRLSWVIVALAPAIANASGGMGTDGDALGFADWLLEQGDNYRAIGEYERSLYQRPEGEAADHARLSIGRAYLRGEQYEAAAAYFEELARHRPDLAGEATLDAGIALHGAANYARSESMLSSWLAAHSSDSEVAVRHLAHYVRGSAALRLGSWSSARGDFAALPDPYRVELSRAVDRVEHAPRKSPLLAGLLAVVPGLGHLYVEQPLTAVAALLWIGLLSFGAVDSFRHGEIGLGVLVGAFDLIWYAGGIFGAVSAAHKYNRDAIANELDALSKRFPGTPLTWPPVLAQ